MGKTMRSLVDSQNVSININLPRAYWSLEKDWLLALVTGTLFCFLAYFSIEFSQFYSEVATVWLPNPVAFIILWRCREHLSLVTLLAIFIGSTASNLLQGNPLQTDLFFAYINVFEITLGYVILKMAKVRLSRPINANSVTLFMIAFGFIAPLFAAFQAALYMNQVMAVPLKSGWLNWYLADGMGYIIYAPILMFFNIKEFTNSFSQENSSTTSIIWAAFFVVTAAIFMQSIIPVEIALFPILVILTYRCGFSAACVALFITALVAFFATFHETGSLYLISTLIDGDHESTQSYLVQGYLALITFSILPMAARIETDKNERKNLEIAYQTADDMREIAVEANNAKTEFLTSMSHELRTPLNAISGFSQLMKQQSNNLNGNQRNQLGSIMQGTDLLIHMVDDILDLANIERGDLKLDIESVNLKLLLDRVAKITQKLAKDKNVKIILGCDEQEYWVHSDPHRMLQVLINLINNAIKYNKEGGWVKIYCKPSGDNITVFVEDNGQGIAKEYWPGVFEKFNRCGQAQGIIRGSGVGLAICHSILQSMNGKINFKSTKGKGSAFWFTLPVAKHESTDGTVQVMALDSSRVAQNSGANTILYVEDNDWNAKLLTDVLSVLPNLDVHVAPSGELGKDLASNINPDLIILDIHLPDTTGFELLDEFRKMDEFSTTPILALTADATTDAKTRGDIAGFDAWLTKPFNVVEIQRIVGNIIADLDEQSSNKEKAKKSAKKVHKNPQ